MKWSMILLLAYEAAALPAFVTVFAGPFADAYGGTTPTATILGVDDAGHTTYALDIAGTLFVPTGSDSPASPGPSRAVATLPGTLVAGADYVSRALSGVVSVTGWAGPGVVYVNGGGACTRSHGADNIICDVPGLRGLADTTTVTIAASAYPQVSQVLDVVGGKSNAAAAKAGVSAVAVGAVVVLLSAILC
ncbi:hypothetical protein MIND_00693000 [Mycena indigotica]|uniref:Uncharacterized protein n=1 Tax=Mycena indigotica TaxID=2126181 RepID=A0A8H6SKW6_9AGAR|nr:uncharacterized protein MIND_00693000 [Mycena indigotica]KAF7301281.1 hypothetical protein MIND_00693000 [Mycena indigotica]